jgi:hypothetical protein
MGACVIFVIVYYMVHEVACSVYQFIPLKLHFLVKSMKTKELFWRYPSKISLLKDLRRGYSPASHVFSTQIYENRQVLWRYPPKYHF